MRTKIVLIILLSAVSTVFVVFSGCKNPGPAEPESGRKQGFPPPDKTPTTLTLYSTEQLTGTIISADAGNQKITWTSSDPNVVTVDANGKITAVGVTNSLSEKYTVTPATGTAVITGTTLDGKTASITVTTTLTPQVSIDTLPAMKDQFKNYFMMGNIAGSANDINGTGVMATRLKRHYNILTAENVMKPGNLTNFRDASTGKINYMWTTNPNNQPDNFVKACADNGFKVHGHTLLWHNQNPNWVWDQIASKKGTIASGMDKEKALAIMKDYITGVMTHFKGKVYSWDVLNEAFPDNASLAWKNAIRKGANGEGQDANPWYVAIGSDFVYEGFLAARLADPGAILYYNDYNTDNINRAMLIYDMVKEVNEKYLALPSSAKPSGDPAGRLLIEGIGMQEHHNTGVAAAKIKDTIDLFRSLKVKLSVSELDVLGQGWGEYSSNSAAASAYGSSTVTNQGLLTQARLYGEYMKLYIENKDIIERVSLWGVIDSQSWRAKGLPLLFDQNGKAKPAYYKMIGALD